MNNFYCSTFIYRVVSCTNTHNEFDFTVYAGKIAHTWYTYVLICKYQPHPRCLRAIHARGFPEKSIRACHSVKYKAEKAYYFTGDELQTSGEMEEPSEEPKSTSTPGGCVNQPNHQECESRRVRPNQRLYIDYSVRQRQRRTNFKAQKPQPYLKPVSSYRITKKHQLAGRSGQGRLRRVTYAESIYSYTPLGVANNEELRDLPKPELAYLIVDLISGTPVFELSDSGKSRATVYVLLVWTLLLRVFAI